MQAEHLVAEYALNIVGIGAVVSKGASSTDLARGWEAASRRWEAPARRTRNTLCDLATSGRLPNLYFLNRGCEMKLQLNSNLGELSHEN